MKKIVRHVNRTALRLLEIAGVLALIAIIGWVGLLWRLSQGPLDVNPWLTHKMEEAFNRDLEGFDFALGGVQLTWGGRFEPFEFEMRDVRITRDDHTPVLEVKKLRVQLSKRNLVFGRFVPRIVRVYGPALRVIRQQDGRFSLNVSTAVEQQQQLAAPPAPEVTPGTPPENAPATETPPETANTPTPAPDGATDITNIGNMADMSDADRQELVRGVLKLLQERSGLGLLDGLREVTVSDAALLYDDRILNVRWLSRDADIDVTRGDAGLRASALVSIDMDRREQATVRAVVSYDWETRNTEATIAFTGFVPSKVAQQSESLKHLADIDMPFTGSLRFNLDPEFLPSTGRFAIGAEAGTFNALGLYETPIPVKSLFMTGKLDVATGKAEVSEIKADLNGPKAQVAVKMATEEGGARVAAVSGVLTDMPMDSLNVYWPPVLAPHPREWILKHLTQGIATRATIEATVAYDAAAEHKVDLRALGGKIDFHGIKVDYFPPLPPVLDVGGTAEYDHSTFSLALDGGKLLDMKVGKSKVVISDLDKIAQGGVSVIDIKAGVNGPLRTALKVLDSKPLRYPEMLGIKTAAVEGKAEDVDVTFNFPIHYALKMSDVQVTAKAKLRDVLLKDVVAGMDVTGGPMTLTVDNGRLGVKGKARLAGMPVDFDWMKNFVASEPVASTLKASLALDAPALEKFGLPESLKISGTMPSEVEYTLKHDKSAVLSLKGDIKPLSFSVPMIGFAKPADVAGSLAVTLSLLDNNLKRASGLELSGGGIAVKGDIDFNPGMGIKRADIRKFALGETDVAIVAEPWGAGGYALKVSGRQLDASPLFRENVKPNSDADAARQVPPLKLSLQVGQLVTGPGRSIARVKASMTRNNWQRIDDLSVDALSGGKPLTLRYAPAAGGHNLKFQAQDAGAALIAFGFAKSVRGGVLYVEGHPRKQGGPRDMAGTATLSNFKINDAPVIAKLLNALSFVGLLEMMGEGGLGFKKARVDFTWTDKGQPGQMQNVRMLRLKDGKTFGSSLGLTFEGDIDNWANTYDLEGTIVPASGLSKLLNVIPIIGNVLTAGGEGIFAATYKVRGTKEKPEVSVNPLSSLAPGILRKIFFE